MRKSVRDGEDDAVRGVCRGRRLVGKCARRWHGEHCAGWFADHNGRRLVTPRGPHDDRCCVGGRAGSLGHPDHGGRQCTASPEHVRGPCRCARRAGWRRLTRGGARARVRRRRGHGRAERVAHRAAAGPPTDGAVVRLDHADLYRRAGRQLHRDHRCDRARCVWNEHDDRSGFPGASDHIGGQWRHDPAGRVAGPCGHRADCRCPGSGTRCDRAVRATAVHWFERHWHHPGRSAADARRPTDRQQLKSTACSTISVKALTTGSAGVVTNPSPRPTPSAPATTGLDGR